MRVQLVNPYPEKFFQSQTMDCYPPLGLLSIAAYLRAMNHELEVEVLDASVIAQNKIEAAIDAHVVGISTTVGTYKNALRIAAKAKEKGARVVLGGPYASVLAEKILLNREYVDCIVAGDGEDAFYRYAEDRPLSEIDNLVYREGDRVVRNNLVALDLDTLPRPAFEYVDVAQYFANFKRRFTFLGEKLESSKELPVFSRKGCAWRMAKGCLFCSIFDRTFRVKTPGRVWTEIDALMWRYKVDGVYDVSDDFLSNIRWLEEFAGAKGKRDVYFVLMGRVSLIDDSTADLLHKLNCVRIFLGIECGEQTMLDRMNKGTTVAQNINAVKSLSERGIKVTAGVVLGAPGENKESLANTMRFFSRLIAFGNLDVIDPSVLIPLPGSPSFSQLLSLPEMAEKYQNEDIFDVTELQRDWVRHFCNIGFEDLLEAIDVLRSQVELSLY